MAAIGDGGAFMALAELETAARLKLTLLVVIYDDAAYGAEVHHFGPMGHDVSLVRFPDADLAAIARAAGAKAATVRRTGDLAVVEEWLSQPARPARPRREGEPDDLRGMARGGLPRRRADHQGDNRMSSIETSTVAALLDAMSGGGVEIVDLTQPLSRSTPVIDFRRRRSPTPPACRETEISRYDERGPAWAWYTLDDRRARGHASRRPDPLGHRQGRCRTWRRCRPVSLVGPACVIDRTAQTEADNGYLLTVADLEAWEAENGARA